MGGTYAPAIRRLWRGGFEPWTITARIDANAQSVVMTLVIVIGGKASAQGVLVRDARSAAATVGRRVNGGGGPDTDNNGNDVSMSLLVEAASVIGERFSLEVVRDLVGWREGEVLDALAPATLAVHDASRAAGLEVVASPSLDRAATLHALLRHAAYAGLVLLVLALVDSRRR